MIQKEQTIEKSLAVELEQEATICRSIFERLPADLFDWKPHKKSPAFGELAVHIIEMIEWVRLAATTVELDYAVTPPVAFKPTTTVELLTYFDVRAAGAIEALRTITDDQMHQEWTVRQGKRIFFVRPRAELIRTDCFNHIIHHRGQLTIYFRLNDILLPGVYGPNNDE